MPQLPLISTQLLCQDLQSGVPAFTLEVTSVLGDEVWPQPYPLWSSFLFFFF